MTLDDGPELLSKESFKGAPGTVHSNCQAAVSGKGHFEKRGDQAPIADVVPGKDQILRHQLLDCMECPLQDFGIIHVRRFVSDLSVRPERKPSLQAGPYC